MKHLPISGYKTCSKHPDILARHNNIPKEFIDCEDQTKTGIQLIEAGNFDE